ncbi:DUF2621 family protein [Bacillaceae bacterium S4-13-58]
MGLTGVFSVFIFLWIMVMVVLLAIGGYFMFRKFFKKLPKEDGKSIQDWEDYYVQQTKNMWDTEEKKLLEELVAPVPELFRDVARSKIAGKIGELAIKRNYKNITQDLIIEGYIQATPKRDHKFLRKTLDEKNIDLSKYEKLFD